MYISFSLDKIRAIAVRDRLPTDKTAEYYQVWELYKLPKLDAKGNIINPSAPTEIRRGFSVAGADKTGFSFKENQVADDLHDPSFIFEVPTLAVGEVARFQLEVQWYESDGSTALMKALYSDATLNRLLEVWEQNGRKEAEAKKALSDWLLKNSGSIVNTAISLVGKVSPFITLATDTVFKALPMITDLVRNNADDFLWRTTFVISFKNHGDHFSTHISHHLGAKSTEVDLNNKAFSLLEGSKGSATFTEQRSNGEAKPNIAQAWYSFTLHDRKPM